MIVVCPACKSLIYFNNERRLAYYCPSCKRFYTSAEVRKTLRWAICPVCDTRLQSVYMGRYVDMGFELLANFVCEKLSQVIPQQGER